MKTTTNIGLKKPDYTDAVDIAIINGNMDTLDTKIQEVKQQIEDIDVSWSGISGKPSTFPPSSHTHDDRYYTETEINTKLSGKANSSHTHTKSQISDFPTSLPANGGNADTVDGKHSGEFVQMPLVKLSATDLNNANYPLAYRTSISDGTQIGLPVASWYHIDYFRHLDNNGFGYQVAYPLNHGGDIYTRWSSGTSWQSWKKINDGGNADTVDGVHANSFLQGSASQVVTGLKEFISQSVGSDYFNPALQIREVQSVGGNNRTIPYAPAIGFHWANTGASSIAMHADGNFYFRSQGYSSSNLVYRNLIANDFVLPDGTSLQSLKSSVVSGKQLVVNAINDKLGYASGLTTSHSFSDYDWWIRNKLPLAPTSTPKTSSSRDIMTPIVSTTRINAGIGNTGRITGLLLCYTAKSSCYVTSSDADFFATTGDSNTKYKKVSKGVRTYLGGAGGSTYYSYMVFNPNRATITFENNNTSAYIELSVLIP